MDKKRELLARLLEQRSAGRAPTAIAIVGVAGRYPKAPDLATFWERLRSGESCIGEIPADRWEADRYFDPDPDALCRYYTKRGGFLEGVDRFDPLLFNISPREAEAMDPQERIFLEIAWETLEDAGYTRRSLSRSGKVGVFAGVMNGNYGRLSAEAFARGAEMHAYSDFHAVANRVSYCFDFTGPSVAVDTACSSSLTAIHLACQSLAAGECRAALAGGVNLILHPLHYMRLSRMRMLSAEGRAKVFGAGADGFVDGEGAGAVLLKPLADALLDGDRIRAVIRGSAINAGGKTSGYTVPNPIAQAEVIAEALEQAGVDPRSISYIEAHGTGTDLGDPIEIAGLTRAYRRFTDAVGFCAIGSAKTNIGHLEAAAGIAGLTKVLLQLEHGELAPSLHASRTNPKIDFARSPFFVQQEAAPWRAHATAAGEEPRRAAVSSFGAGGSNAHLLVEEHRPRPAAQCAPGLRLILLSAATAPQLSELAQRVLGFVREAARREGPGGATALLARLAYTLMVGREVLEHRLAFVAGSIDDVIGGLERYLARGSDAEGLFTGALSGDSRDAAPLAGDAERRAEELLQQGRLDELARAWAGGLDVAWREVIGERPPLLPLPHYPFARERYWATAHPAEAPAGSAQAGQPAAAPAGPARAAASLGGAEPAAHPGQRGGVFRKTLRPADPLTRDHRVSGRPAVAGIAYVELAIAAAASLAGEADPGAIRVEDLVFSNVCWVDEQREIRVALEQAGDHLAFRVESGAEDQPVVHATGLLATRAPRGGAERQPIEDIRARCAHLVVEGDDLYRRFGAAGVEYGPCFRGIARLFVGKGEALAEIAFPAEVEREAASYRLPAMVIDAAIQAVAGLIAEREEDGRGPRVPVAMEAIEVSARLGLRGFAYVRASGPDRFYIAVLGLDGEVLARVRGASFRALPAREPATVQTDAGGQRDDAAPKAQRPRGPAAEARSQAPELRERTIDYLRRVFSGPLRLSAARIDPKARFDRYGIDSLLVLQLMKELEKDLGPLSSSLLFELQTIDALADHLCAHHAARLGELLGVSSSAAAPARAPAAAPAQPLAAASSGVAASRGPRLEAGRSEPIAVIGMSGRYPMAAHLEAFWDNLKAGRDCIRELPLDRRPQWERLVPEAAPSDVRVPSGGFLDAVDAFDARLFHISPREAARMDPQERLFLETAWSLFEDAGYPRRRIEALGGRVGVFVGVMNAHYELAGGDPSARDAASDGLASFWSIANRVSYAFDLYGPSMAVDTACSSSLTAVHLACESLRRGECEMAIAGGVNLVLHPLHLLRLQAMNMLSRAGRSRSFGAGADGFVDGEGVGAVLLKPLKKSLEDGDRIDAVILGSALSAGGRTSGYTVPNPRAQARAIADALEATGVDARTVSYVEAHGTGTDLGDPIEIAGLAEAYGREAAGRGSCAIGTVKSNVGHLESAAGIVGLTKVILMMRHREFVPTLHADPPNPRIDFERTPFRLQREAGPWQRPVIEGQGERRVAPRRAGISSFGAGGANAHVVVEEFIPEGAHVVVEELTAGAAGAAAIAPAPPSSPAIVPLSARNEERLRAHAENLAAWLDRHLAEGPASGSRPDLADIAYSLQVGREAMEARLVVLASSLEELRDALSRFARGDASAERPLFHVLAEGDALPLDGDELRPVIEGLVARGDRARLAELWVKGADVDFRLLPESRGRRVLSLPAYPFARTRYWIAPRARGGERGAASAGARLHPLLDENASTLEACELLTRLDERSRFLRDHRLGGQGVLPGAALLEIARAASAQAGAQAWGARSFRWSSPLVVAEAPVVLRTRLAAAGGVVEAELYTLGPDGDRRVHARGSLLSGDHAAALDAGAGLDLDAIRARCPTALAGEVCYERFEGVGLHVGPAHRVIERLLSGAGEVLAELSLPSVEEGDEQLLLHPALLDGALHAIAPLVEELGGAPALYVPSSISGAAWATPWPRSCAAHVTFAGPRGRGREGDGALRFRIRMADAAGRLLLSIDDVEVRRIEPRPGPSAPDRLFLRPVWRLAPLTAPPAEPPAGDVLVVDRDDRLVRALRARGCSATLVVPGDACLEGEDRWTVRPTCEEDLRALLDAQARRGRAPRVVVFRWDERTSIDAAAALAWLEGDFSSVVLWCRALLAAGSEDVRVLCAIQGAGEELAPEVAAFGELGKCVALEDPRLHLRVVALPASASAEESAALLLREAAAPDEERTVSYRAGARQMRAWDEVRPTTGPAALLKRRGVYVITGGLGGIASALAERLAARLAARLVLCGRSPADERVERALEALRALGGEALYVPADVRDGAAVRRLIDAARARFGSIDGVVHAAGTIRDSLFLRKAPAEMMAVLAPKILGALHLDEATRDERLDFFALCSSWTVVRGNPGQADYAYANSFLDHLAGVRERRRSQGERRGQTVSFVWSAWDVAGMPVDPATKQRLRDEAGLVPLTPDRGYEAFEAGLGLGAPQLLVVDGDAAQIRTAWRSRDRRAAPPLPEARGGGAASRGDAPSGSDVALGGGAARGGDDVPIAAIERLIKEVVAVEVSLRPEEIDAREPFHKLGIDSVMVMHMTQALERTFGELPKTLFFEYPSVAELGRYLMAHRREACLRAFAPRSPEPSSAAESAATSAAQAPPAASRAPATTLGPAAVGPAAMVGPGDAPARRRSSGTDEPIAIVGMSGRYPMANDLAAFWRNLAEGRDCIREIPADRWDHSAYYDPTRHKPGKTYLRWGGFLDGVDRFDAQFFMVTPREAQILDPQERLFLETAWHAVEDAGYTRASLRGARVGVFVGVMYGEYPLVTGGEAGADGMPPGSSFASIANRVSHVLDLRGPSLAVDTMCSSSLTALHLAVGSIRNGECDAALVGGVNLSLHPHKFLLLGQGGFGATDGRCRSFGAGGDGYVPGEGVGAVLLKPLSKAIADGDTIYATIVTSRVNHGGRSNGYTVPNPTAQAEVVGEALRAAGWDPGTVGYVEAHGTGTALGDPIEIRGLATAFGGQPSRGPACALGSVKSNIGHLESAAGIAGLTKVILQMQHGKLVPSIHADRLNPNVDWASVPFQVQRELAPWAPRSEERDGVRQTLPRRAGLSAFGAGGSNAHVLVEEYVPPEAPLAERRAEGPHLFVLSAVSDERLRAYAEALAEHLEQPAPRGPREPADVAYTLQVGREPFAARLAVVASDLSELAARLRGWLRGDPGSGVLASVAAKVTAEALDPGEPRSAQELEELGRRWISGASIAWPALWRGQARRRTPLPGYPFASARHWIRPARGEAAPGGGENGAGEHGWAPVAAAPVALAEAAPVARAAAAPVARAAAAPVARAAAAPVALAASSGENGAGEHGWAPAAAAPVALAAGSGANGAAGGANGAAGGAASGSMGHGAMPPPPPSPGAELALFEPAWREAPLPADGGALPGGSVLVLDADGRFAEALRAVVARVQPAWKFTHALLGSAFHALEDGRYEVDATRRDDWERLLDALEARGATPTHILLCPAAAPPGSGEWAIRRQLNAGLYPVVALCQALLARTSAASTQLLVVDRQPSREDPASLPLYAPLAALARSLRSESSRVIARVVHVVGAPEALADRIWEETRDAAPEVWLRDGRRLARRFSRSGPAPRRDGAPAIRMGGAYVIAGASKGVGRLFARHLAERFDARLVLCGRSEPDPALRAELAAHERAGRRVRYVRADVSRREDVAALLREARAFLGEIHGVLHCAMVQRDGHLAHKRAEDIEAVLAPKVHGTVLLDEATSDDPLDWFAVTSSLAGLIGSATQTDYVFATGFQDEYMGYRERLRAEGKRRGKSLSVDWPLWEEGGTRVEQVLADHVRAQTGVAQLPTHKGIEAFERALRADSSQVVVLYGRLDRADDLLGGAALGERLAGARSDAAARSDDASRGGDLQRRTEAYVCDLIADVTGRPRESIAPNVAFADYGFDSIVLSHLKARLEEDIAEISPATVLAHPSVQALSSFLLAEHRERVLSVLGRRGGGEAAASGAGAAGDDRGAGSAQQAAAPAIPVERQDPLAFDGGLRPEPRRAPAPAATSRDDDAIAVIGIAGRYPGARNPGELWQRLLAGQSGITAVPAERWRTADGQRASGAFLEGVDRFDPLFFQMTPLEAEQASPEERLLLETAWEALEDAAIRPSSLRGRPVGVFVGMTTHTYPLLTREQDSRGAPALDGAHFRVANRLSIFFDLLGPSFAVDTACSSSLVALHLACQSIRSGDCEAALVGGANLYLHPSKFVNLSRARLLGARPDRGVYAADGDGFIPGEGVGVVVLKPLRDALRDGDPVHAVILGSKIRHKGKGGGASLPSPKEQAAVAAEALAQSAVDPGTVGLVEVQATGSSLADAAEWAALQQVYGGKAAARGLRCAVSALSGHLGHSEGASGVAQLTAVLLQMRHGRVAPVRFPDRLNPEVNLARSTLALPSEPTPWEPVWVEGGAGGTRAVRRAGISSVGVGGTMVHVVLEAEAGAPRASAELGARAPRAELVLLTARTRDGLVEQVRRLHRFLVTEAAQEAEPIRLGDLAWTLTIGREHFAERLALVVESKEQLAAALGALAAGQRPACPTFAGTAAADDGHGAAAASPPPRDLEEAARRFVKGASADALGLTSGPPGRRLRLPTYPFERRRCWPHDDAVVTAAGPLPAGAAGPLPTRAAEALPARAAAEAPAAAAGGNAAAGYYNHVLSALDVSSSSGANDHLILAPFTERVDGFSWVLTFADPERHAEHYRLALEKQQELKQMLFRGVDLTRATRALDIGCGLGTDLMTLARAYPNLRADGFNITSRQVEVARRRIDAAGLSDRVCVHEADSSRTPFPGRYDLVIGFEVGVHIQDKDGLFSNIARHLSDSGRVLLADVVARTAAPVHKPELGHYTSTEAELARCLARSGLRVESCVDASREVANFLDDPRFEENLAALHRAHPALEQVAPMHRGWLRFGKALALGLFRYVALTLRKSRPDEAEAAVAEENLAAFVGSRSYSEVIRGAAPLSRASSPAAGAREASAPVADVAARVAEIVRGVLRMQPHELDIDARFADFGVDSLQGLQVLESINRELGLSLEVHALYDHASVRDLSRHVAKIYAERRPAPRAAEHHEARAAAPSSGCVAVIGMAGRFPGAGDVFSFWENLRGGVESVREVPGDRWDAKRYYEAGASSDSIKTLSKWGGFLEGVDRFDGGFFGIAPAEGRLMDPQQRLMLEACWAALEDAGYARKARGARCGVCIGVLGGDYQDILRESGGDDQYRAHAMIGNATSILAARIAYFLDLKGGAVSLDTACSSSLVAVHKACQELVTGEADLMIAGGVTLYLTVRPYIMMSRAGMLSPTGQCRAFDDGADGIVPGEAVGAVVLKRLEDALRDGDRIDGIIRASGMNQDGRTNGITAPSAASQEALLLDVWRKAGIDPESISLIEAHGTGTPLGDPIEIAALTSAFRRSTDRRRVCAIGSVKSNIGHTSGAAGVVSLIKALLAMRHREIPPSLHFARPNRHTKLDESPFYVSDRLHPWQQPAGGPRRAAVSSFGFSGTNCHVVVEEHVAPKPLRRPEAVQIVVLSARTEERLRAYAEALRAFLAKRRGAADLPGLDEIAFTLQVCRTPMPARLAVVASSVDELVAQLSAYLDGREDGRSLVSGLLGRRDDVGGGAPALAAPGFQELTPERARELSRLWVAGGEIAWQQLYRDPLPAKVALPLYPFERERHWVGAAVDAATAAVVDAPPARAQRAPRYRVEELCYEPRWLPAPLDEASPDLRPIRPIFRGSLPEDRDGVVLVVIPEGLSAAVRVIEAWHPGRRTIAVTLSAPNGHRPDGPFEVDASDPAGWSNLLASLQGRGIGALHTVYFLGGLRAGNEPLPLDPRAVSRSTELGVIALYRLSRALIAHGALGRTPIEIKIAMANVHRVRAEDAARPHFAELHGFAMTLSQEFPTARVTSIDLDLHDLSDLRSADELAARLQPLRREPPMLTGEPIAIRGGRRWVRRLFQVAMPEPAAPVYRDRGVYLILGGAGGVGRELCRDLARRYKARLVIVGRSPLDEARRRLLSEIEAAGGEALYVRADAADLDSMRGAVSVARARFGRIAGAFHSGLVLSRETLRELDEQSLRAVLAPKVVGSVAFYESLRDEPLDFMAFFSSALSFACTEGRSHYAAASTFEDAYVCSLIGRAPFPVLLVNWGVWDVNEIDPAGRARLEGQGVSFFAPEDGIEALRRVLDRRAGQFLCMALDEHGREQVGIVAGHAAPPQPEPRAPEPLPSGPLAPARRSILPELPAIIPPPDPALVERLRSASDELEPFVHLLLLDAFQRMGRLLGRGERYEPARLAADLRIVPARQRQFDALLTILEKAGFVTRHAGELVSTGEIDRLVASGTLASLDQGRERLLQRFPEVKSQLKVVSLCAQRLPEILRGEVPATDVLFADPSNLENIYGGNTTAAYFNGLVATVFEAYVGARLAELPPGERVAIVEIGGGTGSTTGPVLKASGRFKDRISYTFTDLSRAFIALAQRRFKPAHPFLEGRVLDIERDVVEQGFSAGSYDMVIAANVLHATRNIRGTIRHARSLLKPGGLMVLYEVTRNLDLLTIIFGCLDGWWLYTDPEQRIPHSPISNVSTWFRLLREEGFTVGGAFGEGDGSPDAWYQAVLVAERADLPARQPAAPEIKAAPPPVAAPPRAELPAAQPAAPEIKAAPPPAAPPPRAGEREARIERFVIDSLCNVLQIDRDKLDLDQPFLEMGVDSIMGVDIINNLNKELDVRLKTTDLFSLTTPRMLLDHLMKTASAPAAPAPAPAALAPAPAAPAPAPAALAPAPAALAPAPAALAPASPFASAGPPSAPAVAHFSTSPVAETGSDEELGDLLRRLGSGESVELDGLLELSRSSAQ
ncbi:SDR family NAD(P)-dependent oxidoreductase [Sorangium cellulosum]|nr:SDR family NAD(P)-dependent oxidoreductase [Sorangium cellulosum]